MADTIAAGSRKPPAKSRTILGASLKAYNPTFQDRIGAIVSDVIGPDMARRIVGSAGVGRGGPMAGSGLLDMTPVGGLFALDEFGRGDTLAAAGAIPGARAGSNAMREATKSFRLFHGSPEAFGKLDSAFIGTGEQALLGRGGEGLEAQGHFLTDWRPAARGYSHGRHKSGSPELPVELKSGARRGHVYEVEVKANPDDFLPLDTRIAEMSPRQRQALGIAEDSDFMRRVRDDAAYSAKKGSRPYYTLKEYLEEFPGAERELARRGVPGVTQRVTYNRPGWKSRKKTTVYTVFPGNEHLLKVVRRYGVAGAATAGAGAATIAAGRPTEAQAKNRRYRTGGGF